MIERSRRFGENFVIESENEDEDENKDSVLKRYEKTFGKIKDFENKNEKNKGLDKNNDSKRLKSKILRKRSKSMISEISTESQKIMIEKLMKLKQEEDKIGKEKKELISFLESRTHSKVSSRPVTVASLLKKN